MACASSGNRVGQRELMGSSWLTMALMRLAFQNGVFATYQGTHHLVLMLVVFRETYLFAMLWVSHAESKVQVSEIGNKS